MRTSTVRVERFNARERPTGDFQIGKSKTVCAREASRCFYERTDLEERRKDYDNWFIRFYVTFTPTVL